MSDVLGLLENRGVDDGTYSESGQSLPSPYLRRYGEQKVASETQEADV